MAYSEEVASRVRHYLSEVPGIIVREKKMFGGIGFLVNDKMCVNVMKDRLMCRYNPSLEAEVTSKDAVHPMVMKSKQMKGYCYVDSSGFETESDLSYWIELCLAFNDEAKSSKKK